MGCCWEADQPGICLDQERLHLEFWAQHHDPRVHLLNGLLQSLLAPRLHALSSLQVSVEHIPHSVALNPSPPAPAPLPLPQVLCCTRWGVPPTAPSPRARPTRGPRCPPAPGSPTFRPAPRGYTRCPPHSLTPTAAPHRRSQGRPHPPMGWGMRGQGRGRGQGEWGRWGPSQDQGLRVTTDLAPPLLDQGLATGLDLPALASARAAGR